MARPRKTQTSKTPPVEAQYEVEVDLGDKVIKGSGETAHAALASLTPPIKIFTKMFLTIRHGGKKANMMFMPLQAKRVFYPLSQPFLAKKLEYLMK